MMKIILAFCLVASLVNAQVTFPSTVTANNAWGTTANSVFTSKGSGADQGNGYTVGLDEPGWVLSNTLGLTVAATPTAVTVYTTLKTATGGYVGVGIAANSGNGLQSAACSAFGTTHAAASLANMGAGATTSNACPSDFLTIYTAAPSSTTTSLTVATISLSVGLPIRWVLTPPTQSTAYATACVTAQVTPFTAIGGASAPTAGTPIVRNTGGTCELSSSSATYPASKFTQTSKATDGTTDVTAATFAFYVELGPSGTRGEVCFQTAAQFTANPGVCVGSTIISGVLASIGLLVALLFN